MGRPSSSVNWAGFYVTSKEDPNQLVLGPFHGRPACQTITFGKGVCGIAAAEKKTVIVPDVDKWQGHIACDAESKSEIVVPIIRSDKVRGTDLGGSRSRAAHKDRSLPL